MKALFSVLAIVLGFIGPVWSIEPIYIGICLPVTGNMAVRGQSVWEGIKIAHKVEPRVLGRPVELKLVDTKSDPAGAANAAFALIEKERVVAIIGAGGSSDTVAASLHAEGRRIPLVTPLATSHMITSGKRYTFSTCPLDVEQAHVAAETRVEAFQCQDCRCDQRHVSKLQLGAGCLLRE